MRILTARFVCRLLAGGIFPSWRGSMLRGALGGSLRRAMCATRQDDCGACVVSSSCIFRRLFMAADNGHTPQTAPPYCLETYWNERREFAAGETFSFTLKLFSFAADYLPYFVHAFTQAGRRGLGMEKAGVYIIQDIIQDGKSIYDAESETLSPPKTAEIALPRLLQPGDLQKLRMDALTPLRFKQANRLSTDLSFAMLVSLITRRARDLAALDGQTYSLPPDEFARLKKLSATIVTLENRIRWLDLGRYSSRQQQAMRFGGLAGHVVYGGRVSAFAEFLEFASQTHIGKQTSFGLGNVSFQYCASNQG